MSQSAWIYTYSPGVIHSITPPFTLKSMPVWLKRCTVTPT